MHIKDLDKVESLVARRKQVLDKITECGPTLNVVIGGRYQDQEFIEAARTAVMALLASQLASVEESLKQYGVKFD